MARLCRYLPESGIQPIVLTVQERFVESRDDSFPPPDGILVERTAVMATPLDIYKRFKGNLAQATSGGNRNSNRDHSDRHAIRAAGEDRHRLLYRHAVGLVTIPDLQWGWYLPAIRAAEELIEREPIAAIFSSGPPWTSHLIARHLKKKYHIPWVIDFRDAWITDVWRDLWLPGWRHRVDRLLEASCVKWADLVTCVTDYIRDDLVRRYSAIPPAKFFTLKNGYDSEDDIPSRASTVGLSSCGTTAESGSRASNLESETLNSRRLILHLGDLYMGRRIDTFCQTVEDLVRLGKIDPRTIQVLFVGNNDDSIVAAARQRAPQLMRSECVEFRERVSWQEGQSLLARAGLLLIFQGDHPGLTAKFFEYLTTGKPILAMAREGELSAMLLATGAGLSADSEDRARIAAKFLEALALPVRPAEEVKRVAGQYHYRNLAKQLADQIHDLIAVDVRGGR